MFTPLLTLTLAATILVPGLPWIRKGETDLTAPAASPSPGASIVANGPRDRVLVLSSEDPEYRALAIRPSVRTNLTETSRLLVFQDGLCVLDRGLRDDSRQGGSTSDGRVVVEQSGTTERAVAADDASAAVLVSTRYVSRVDITPGDSSADRDSVSAVCVLTLVDPRHPEGRWQLTLEDGRWAKDVSALPGAAGVALTSFVPRSGPVDFRVLDASGHETLRIPESRGETVAIGVASGGVVAADVMFHNSSTLPERGVVVFDLASGTNWTYGWRYGSDDEPVSWSLGPGGVLTVRLTASSRRFDRGGRRL